MFSVPGVTADTTITSATFSFGTTAGGDIPGVPPICPVALSRGFFCAVAALVQELFQCMRVLAAEIRPH